MPRVLVVATLLSTALVRASAQQVVFRVETDLVSFGVTVTDKRGSFVTDLTGDDFEILEDGKPQTLKYFIRGHETEEAPELHVGIMFDTSGSMAADIATARTAAIKFLNSLPEAKDITLVDFDSEVRLAKYGQQDFPRLVERIRSRKPDGYTAMYDALGQYVTGADCPRVHRRDDPVAWVGRHGLSRRLHAESVAQCPQPAPGPPRTVGGRERGRGIFPPLDERD